MPKIIPQYCNAADLLVVAALEWRAGNKKDALTIAAGAFNDPSMVELAAALHIFNKAAAENIPIEDILNETPEQNPQEDDNKNIEDDITPAVSSVMERLIKREYSAGTVSPEDPYSGPGGDAEDDDILTHLREEENPDGDGEKFSDMDTDADIENLINKQDSEETEPDPANPEEMEEHPAEAADIDDDNNEVAVEDDDNDALPPKTTSFSDKIANLSPDLRAIANRLSINGDRDSRALAAEIISNNRVKRA